MIGGGTAGKHTLGFTHVSHFRWHPFFFTAHGLLQCHGKFMLLLCPLRHANQLYVLIDQLSQCLVMMSLVDGRDNPHIRQLGTGGQGSAFGTLQYTLVHILQALVGISQKVPDTRLVRNHIGRFAALENDMVHAVSIMQMLA